MYSESFSLILDQVTTKPELDALVGEIDMYRDNMYRLGKEPASLRSGYLLPMLRRERNPSEAPLSGAKWDKDELDKLRQAALDLPMVRLTLALPPPGNWILEIRNWVMKAVGKAVILDMAVDKSILGGAIIENAGKYGDYSLRKKINAYAR